MNIPETCPSVVGALNLEKETSVNLSVITGVY